MPRIYSTGELAGIFSAAPRTVTRWIDAGRLRGYRLPTVGAACSGRRYVQHQDALAFAVEHGLHLAIERLTSLRSLVLVSVDSSYARAIRDALPEWNVSLAGSPFEAAETTALAYLIGTGDGFTTALHLARHLARRNPTPRVTFAVPDDGLAASQREAMIATGAVILSADVTSHANLAVKGVVK